MRNEVLILRGGGWWIVECMFIGGKKSRERNAGTGLVNLEGYAYFHTYFCFCRGICHTYRSE